MRFVDLILSMITNEIIEIYVMHQEQILHGVTESNLLSMLKLCTEILEKNRKK